MLFFLLNTYHSRWSTESRGGVLVAMDSHQSQSLLMMMWDEWFQKVAADGHEEPTRRMQKEYGNCQRNRRRSRDNRRLACCGRRQDDEEASTSSSTWSKQKMLFSKACRCLFFHQTCSRTLLLLVSFLSSKALQKHTERESERERALCCNVFSWQNAFRHLWILW